MKSKIIYYLPLLLLLIFCFNYFLWPKDQNWVSFQAIEALKTDSQWLADVGAKCKKLVPLHNSVLENEMAGSFYSVDSSFEERCFLSVETKLHSFLYFNYSGISAVSVFNTQNEILFSKSNSVYVQTPLVLTPLLVFFICFFLGIPFVSLALMGIFYLLALYGLDAEKLLIQAWRIQSHTVFYKRDFWVLLSLGLILRIKNKNLKRISKFASFPLGILNPSLFSPLFLSSLSKYKKLLNFVYLQALVFMLSFLVLKVRLLGVRTYFFSFFEKPPYFSLALLGLVFSPLFSRLKRVQVFPSSDEKVKSYSYSQVAWILLVIDLAYLVPELIDQSQLLHSMITWFELKNSSSDFQKFLVPFFFQISCGKLSFEWAFPNIALNNVMLDAWWIGALFSPFSIFQILPAKILSFSFKKTYRFSWLALYRPLLVLFMVYGVVEVTQIRILEPVVFVFILFVFFYLELHKRNWKLEPQE